jgi:hypothetical protein
MPTPITHTIKSSGGDYTTLLAWESAEQRDLVAADETETAEVYDLDAGRCTVAGFTTDATRFPAVRANAADHTTGVWTGVGARIEYVSTSPLHAFLGQDPFTQFQGLAVRQTGTFAQRCVEGNPGDGYVFEELYVENASATVTGDAYAIIFGNQTGAQRSILRNAVAICKAGAAGTRYGLGMVGAHTVDNVTCVGRGQSIVFNVILKNVTLVKGTSTGTNWTNDSGGAVTASDCTVEDTSLVGTNIQQNTVPVFEDAPNDDYNLGSADTAATAQGQDLSGSFTVDVAGITRTLPWDIGAFRTAVTPSGGGGRRGVLRAMGFRAMAGQLIPDPGGRVFNRVSRGGTVTPPPLAPPTGMSFWQKKNTNLSTTASPVITPPTDGQAIQEWNDNSANAIQSRNLIATDRPIYRADYLTSGFIGNEFKVAPNNQFLRAAPGALVPMNGAVTVFAAIFLDANPAFGEIVNRFEPGLNNPGAFLMNIDGSDKFEIARPFSTTVLSTGTVARTVWVVVGVRIQAAGASDTKMFLDGETTTETTTLNDDGTAAAIQELWTGRFSSGAFQANFNGAIGELIIYDSALSDADITTLVDYLEGEFGL